MKAEKWLKDNYFDSESGDWIHYDYLEAMEEYAQQKIREKLIKFAGNWNKKLFGCDSKYLIAISDIDKYLRQRNANR